jgi:pyruvate,water dikinase
VAGLKFTFEKSIDFLKDAAKKLFELYGDFVAEWLSVNGTVYMSDFRKLAAAKIQDKKSLVNEPVLRDDTFLAKKDPIVAANAYGKVHIVSDPEDADKLEMGEMLVTKYALPAWSAAFGKISGIITENGGLTCHLAILAREAHVPSIFGVEDVMRKITGYVYVYMNSEGEIYGK